MYPDTELNRLAGRKLVLHRRIALHRLQCVQASGRLARPVEWIDKVLGIWRQVSPVAKFAALPLAFLVQRKIFSRRRLLGSLVRWAPLVFKAVRVFGAASRNRAGS